MSIRPATPADTDAVVDLIRELADYERSLDQVKVDPGELDRHLFSEPASVFCHVAQDPRPEAAGAVVGFALWFLNFSTWEGRHGIYLEDLYVRPSARGLGLGRALLATLAGIAADRGYLRVDWAVLEWNSPAIGFYRSLGAVPMQEWRTYRLAGSALHQLAAPQR